MNSKNLPFIILIMLFFGGCQNKIQIGSNYYSGDTKEIYIKDTKNIVITNELNKLKNIQELIVHNSVGFRIEIQRVNTTIKTLTVLNCGLKENDWIKYFTRVEILHLDSNSFIEVPDLSANTKLKTLTIGDNVSLFQVGICPSLQHLVVKGNITSLAWMANFPNLEGISIQSSEALDLNTLPILKKIKSINIEGNIKLPVEGILNISESLERMSYWETGDGQIDSQLKEQVDRIELIIKEKNPKFDRILAFSSTGPYGLEE